MRLTTKLEIPSQVINQLETCHQCNQLKMIFMLIDQRKNVCPYNFLTHLECITKVSIQLRDLNQYDLTYLQLITLACGFFCRWPHPHGFGSLTKAQPDPGHLPGNQRLCPTISNIMFFQETHMFHGILNQSTSLSSPRLSLG